MHKKILALLLLVFLIAGLLTIPQRARAATGTIYLTPSGTIVQSGNSFTVSLRINPGTAVDGVQATVSYSTSMLQETAADTSSSPFSAQLQKTVSGGNITIALGSLSGSISSDSLIASITFTALASSGSTSLQVSNANASSSGSYTDPTTANASVSFTAAPTSSTPPPTTTTTTTGGTTKKSTNSTVTTTTPSTPGAPAPVQKVTTTSSIKSLQYSLATIAVNTDVPVQVALQYGTAEGKLDQSTPFTALGTKNSVSLDSAHLVPGTTYYYEIITKDGAGNSITGAVKSFKTKGYTVKVTVLDSHYRPVSHQAVILHSTPTTAKTDSSGVVTFTDVSPGMHSVAYSQAKSKTYTHEVYVDNNVLTNGATQTAPTQTAAVILASFTQPTHSGNQALFIVLAAVAFVGAGLYMLYVATPAGDIIRQKLGTNKSAASSASSVIKPSSS